MDRDPTQLSAEVIGSQVEMLLNDRPTKKPQEPGKSQRKRTPHARDRARRQMSITFPDPEWRDAIRNQAAAWDIRPSDLIIWAISQAMAMIEAGTVERPDGEQEIYHRSGAMLDLPWEPE